MYRVIRAEGLGPCHECEDSFTATEWIVQDVENHRVYHIIHIQPIAEEIENFESLPRAQQKKFVEISSDEDVTTSEDYEEDEDSEDSASSSDSGSSDDSGSSEDSGDSEYSGASEYSGESEPEEFSEDLKEETRYTEVIEVQSWKQCDALKLHTCFIMVSGSRPTDWCPPCKTQGQVFRESETNIPKVMIKVTNAGDDWSAHGLNVDTVPYFILKEGTEYRAIGSKF